MILRTSTIVALIGAASGPIASSAFRCHPSIGAPSIKPSIATAMHMSSDDEEGSKYSYSLPPAPEDGIALGGDMVALFVYSYLDHTVNEMFLEAAAEADNVADHVANYDPTGTLTLDASLPVWFDPSHLRTFGHNWLAAPCGVDASYAPAIAHSGLAFVSIATSWLACGYLSGAFLESNTTRCNPSRAVLIVLRTWAGTAAIMVSLALGSDALWGYLDGVNALSAPARGGLTKADADFIFDSLSVLTFWRFMFNWLCGTK